MEFSQLRCESPGCDCEADYFLQSEIFSFDRLFLCEICLGKYVIDRYIVNDEDMLVFHFLKSRNGTTRMSFFKLDRTIMRIVEIDTPAQASKKVSI